MSTDTTFDDFGFDKYIEESERDRNIRENARLGYVEMGSGGNAVTPAEDPLLAFYEKQPPMSDAEQATFWKQQALARRVFNSTMDAARPPGEPPPFVTVKHAVAQMESLAMLNIVQTGIPTLDRVMTHGTTGIIAGQVYNVVAQTGRGKTSFVNQIALHTAGSGHEVVNAFYEAGAWYSVARMAAPLLNVSSNTLLRAVETVDDKRVLKYGADIIEKVPDRIHLLDRPSIETIRHSILYLADKTGSAPILIIDYAQKLADIVQASQKRPDARLAMSEASSALMEIADETKATVIAVQSMSRMNGRRMKDVRKLAPFELVDVAKESGAVEYDAAGMIVLTLSDDYEGEHRIGTMTIAKARFGIECHVDMRFHGASGLWVDKGRVEAEPDDDAREVIIAELENGPAKNPTELVKRCLGNGVNRGALFVAIKEMTNETFEITRTDRGLELA